MKVKFKTLKFKNILSYGNEFTTFSFTSGLNAITGKNGHGKSSLSDVLTFCLYGKPFRDIKIAELVNRINSKNLITEVEFDIDNDSYKIVRGLKPVKFNFYKNGEELDLLSSKTLVQNEIDDLLGVDFNLFRQIVSLSVNASKPFLTLSAYEKRNIVETIFNIDIFGEMMKVVKTNLTTLRVDQKIKTNEYSNTETSYKSLLGQVTDYESTKKHFDENKKKLLQSIEESVIAVKQDIKKSKDNIKTCESFIKKTKLINNIDELKNERDSISKDLGILTYKISKLESDNEFLNKHDECIYCGNAITDSHRNTHLSENTLQIEEAKEEHTSKKARLELLISKIKTNEESISTVKAAQNKIISENQKIDIYNDQLKEKHELLVTTKSNKLSLDEKTLYKNLGLKKTDYDNIKVELENINKSYEINTAMAKVLSDDGVKTYFLKKLLPLLNSYINKYLERFDMPFIFEFDEMLNEKISTVIGRCDNVSYFSCSEGEKKRIDISIMLSFIDIIKTISNWDCNLLFIDELLDSAVDSSNLNLILDAIKQMSIENKEECIYVISHRADHRGWDKVYNVTKNGSFSTISED